MQSPYRIRHSLREALILQNNKICNLSDTKKISAQQKLQAIISLLILSK